MQQCEVTCSGAQSCERFVRCNKGTCDLACTGAESCNGGVDCDTACACSADCSGPGACDVPTACPDDCLFACDPADACDSCP
jgi:hypothetical protein